jgi:hypothetical protein
VPDPDADGELGVADVAAIADEDLKGSRLLLVRRAIAPIDLDGTSGGVIQLACTFQPAEGLRFTSAQFRLRFMTPPGIRIIDLAPRSLDDPNPVEFTLSRKGQLGIKSLPVPIESSFEAGVSEKFVRYHCNVQGSGEGTNLARWDFRENADRRDGIGREHVLTLTLPLTGIVTGSLIVSARLVRPGLRGVVDAIRDMILVAPSSERIYGLSFDIPATPSTSVLSKFLHLVQ